MFNDTLAELIAKRRIMPVQDTTSYQTAIGGVVEAPPLPDYSSPENSGQSGAESFDTAGVLSGKKSFGQAGSDWLTDQSKKKGIQQAFEILSLFI